MTRENDFKQRIILAAAMVQCLVHGFYTLMFMASIGFTVILKPARTWLLLLINVAAYALASATSVFDVVVVVVGMTDEDDTNLGYPEPLVRVRLSFSILISIITQSLIVWRFLRLWNRMTYIAVIALFIINSNALFGLITMYWRESGSVELMYGIYRRIRFSIMAVLGAIIFARTYWMSKKLNALYGPYFRTRAYTPLGAFVDGGCVATLFLLTDIVLRIHVIRYFIPQMMGLAATFILYQEAVGRAARDIDDTARDLLDRGDGTPVLDTIFSTPCVSLHAGPSRPTRARTMGSEFSSVNSDFDFEARRGNGESGLQGPATEKSRKSRSVLSVITGRQE